MSEYNDVMTDIAYPRIHITEFLSLHPELTDVYKAGFRVFVGLNKIWMRYEEWSEKLIEYQGKGLL